MATAKLSATKSTSRAINYVEKRAVEKNGLNCDVDYAKSSFKASRELYGKTDGNWGHVIIQSFKPDKVIPEQRNQLDLELAEKLVLNYQVAVHIHNDTGHVYSHIVINPIDPEIGKKSNNNKQALRNVRDFSDEICREHGLSVSERDAAKSKYTQVEKALIEKDQCSWKGDLWEKIENAKDHTSDFKSLLEHLEKSGIEFKVRGKNVLCKPENVNKWVRGKTFGKDYDKGALEYEFERRERGEEKESEWGAVATYTDQFEIDWDAIEHNTEQLRKTRTRRIEETKQAHHQVSNRDTREPERTRERTKATHTEFDRGDEGFPK